MRYLQILLPLLVLSTGCHSAQTVPQRTESAAELGNADALQSPESEQPESANTDIKRLPAVQGIRPVDTQPGPVQPVVYNQPVVQPLPESRFEAEVVPSPPLEDGGTPPSFSLTQLESIAIGQNPAVAQAAAEVRALQGKYIQVGLPPNPTIGYTASEIGDSGRAGQQGAYVGQQFITGGKLRLNRAVASQEVQQAQQRLAAARERVLTDVRIAFYEVLVAQQRLVVTEDLLEVGQRGVRTVEALLEAKEASGPDLLQSQIEANTAHMLIENARAARLGAWLRLTAVIGAPEMPMAQVAGDLSSDLPNIDATAAVEQILTASPQLAAAYTDIERARYALERARVEVVPDLNLQGTAQYDYASEMAIAGAQVGLPLPIINRNQGGIAQAQSELASAQQNARRLELALRKQYASVYQRYLIARQQVDRYRSEIVPQARETLQLTSQGYEFGELSYLQLLTVQRTYFQTNLAYLDALGRMWAASREIEGLLLSGSLEARIAEL